MKQVNHEHFHDRSCGCHDFIVGRCVPLVGRRQERMFGVFLAKSPEASHESDARAAGWRWQGEYSYPSKSCQDLWPSLRIETLQKTPRNQKRKLCSRSSSYVFFLSFVRGYATEEIVVSTKSYRFPPECA